MVLHIAPWQPSLSSRCVGRLAALQQQQEDKPGAVGAQKDPKRENPAADSSHNYTKITNTKYKNYQLYETKLYKKISSVRTLQQIRHTFNPAADKSKPLT